MKSYLLPTNGTIGLLKPRTVIRELVIWMKWNERVRRHRNDRESDRNDFCKKSCSLLSPKSICLSFSCSYFPQRDLHMSTRTLAAGLRIEEIFSASVKWAPPALAGCWSHSQSFGRGGSEWRRAFALIWPAFLWRNSAGSKVCPSCSQLFAYAV